MVIDMRSKSEADIYEEFLEVTKATEVATTDEEQEQLRDLTEQRERSVQDREQSRKLLAARRREEMLLEQARRAVA